MSAPSHATDNPHDTPSTPRADLIGGLLWLALGAVITIMSVCMGRLRDQHINPYTVPGLVPGLLGLAMMLLGALLATRGWCAGARLRASAPQPVGLAQVGHDPHSSRAIHLRIAIVLALCMAFGIGLVGHGLPFWAAAAIFVTTAVLILQAPKRKAAGAGLSLRTVLVAAIIGLGAGGVITVLFQDVFLVHLP